MQGGKLIRCHFMLKWSTIIMSFTADWVELHKRAVEGNFSVSDRVKLTEIEIRQMIMKYTNGAEPIEIGLWEKSKRNAMLANLRQAGLSIREIERATGVSKGTSPIIPLYIFDLFCLLECPRAILRYCNFGLTKSFHII